VISSTQIPRSGHTDDNHPAGHDPDDT